MSDTSWDFEAPSSPKPSRPDVPRIGTQAAGAPNPNRPSSTAGPSGPPLGRTVFAAPSSPSRPVGDRTGVLPPPLPSPPVQDRFTAQQPNLNLTTSAAPTFTPPATPPTVVESAQRVQANARPANPKPKGSWGWRALAAFVAGAVVSGAAFTAGTIATEPDEVAAPQTTTVVNPAPSTLPPATGPATENPAAFVAEELGPSVVQVLTNFGTGSGVVFQDGGYIMTNNHVIEDAEEIFIGDYQGRTLAATLIGRDPRADIAVLQVEGLDLPIASLAVGQQLQVGQSAIAIGSPFDLTRTVTAGIISALNRPLENQNGTFTSMIQTDAPINPGNSGGPLANRLGEVIGINTAIRTDGVSNSNIGVGFAVPIDTANRVAERIIAGQSLEPGFLGVGRGQAAIGDVGVVIQDITVGSGADLAGLESGDRVLTVDGAPVTSFEELAGLITNNFPGDSIELEIVRGETNRTISATLGDRP